MNKLQADEQLWNRCLHELVEEQAERTPLAPALRYSGQQLSFAELNERANRCAWYLRGIGIGPDSIVGVLLERSVEMVVALLGVMKAGGAYLPLDCEYPKDRLDFILEDAGVSALLTQDKRGDKLQGFDGTIVCLDGDWDSLEEERPDNPDRLAAPEHLAYVIYTSGSTGKPKGCMLPHRAVCNRLVWMQQQYGLDETDRVLQKTPFTFDVSVWEFFWPLISGACLVLAKPNGHKDSDYLVRLIQQEQITVCHFVPSMLRFFLQNPGVQACRSLRHVFTSGEVLTPELAAAFRSTIRAKLHNLYGPTEAAIDVTYWECEEREDRRVPIGRPISNIRLHILDEALQPVPEGELYIGGVGLARGYLNRKELTAAAFIPDPFGGEAGARLYKTGDRARLLTDGTVEYLGRLDFQVKLRGNRVELGEIETVLRGHEAVEDTVVLVRDEESGDPKLVAYVETCGKQPEVGALRIFLKSKLPEYMVPNRVVYMDALPVTSHGKLDRKALPWPAGEPGSAAKAAAESDDRQRDSILAGLLEQMQQLLGVQGLGADDDLFDNGATSLTMVQVVERINRQFGVAVPVELFLDEPTVSAIADYIARNTRSSKSVDMDTAACGNPGGSRGTDAGKPLGAAVQAASHAASPSYETAENTLLRDLTAYFAEVLNMEVIQPEEDLFDLGATSLTMVQMVEKIRDMYGISVPVEVFLDEPTLAAVLAYVVPRIDTAGVVLKQQAAPALETLAPAPQSGNEKAVAASSDKIGLSPAVFKPSAYSRSEAARGFVRSRISFRAFSQMLALLKATEAESGKYKYHYPSAGGLNAIQTYVYVKEQRVEGLRGGLYYYHPEKHVLALLSERFGLEHTAFMPCDRDLVDAAGFALFFIVQMDAIVPIYQMGSQVLATVEAGYMGQLLVSRQADYGLGVYPVTGVDFGDIRKEMHLEQGHRFLHCLLGGTPDPSMSVADGQEARTTASYLRQSGVCVTEHFRNEADEGAFAPCLDIDSISQWDQLQVMGPKEHFRFMAKRLHLREIEGAAVTALDTPPEQGSFEIRASQRNYQSGPVPLERLGKLLALFRPQDGEGRARYLFADVAGIRSVSVYLYVKEGGIENLREGIYRYDAAEHVLVWLSAGTEGFVKQIHTPFNRKHFQSSAFNLFFIGRIHELEPVFKEESLYYALLEAGYMGQLLVERQAEFGIGVCPIGGLKFERVRAAFHLDENDVMLHSFTCGRFEQTLPSGWSIMEDNDGKSALEGDMSSRRLPLKMKRTALQHDLAIVGLSGRYPGADSLEEYWELLKDGRSAISPISDERRKLWGTEEPAGQASKDRGGYLEHIDHFDNLLFHISGSEARTMDPQERLLLEAALECLNHAGYTAEGLSRASGSVGVFVGAMWSDYQNRCREQTGDSIEAQPSAFHSSIANRISYYFNFLGPSVAVNTSCSSAVTAIHLACESIKRGECEAALVGGVNLLTDEYHQRLLKSIDFLSKDGECRPFSAQATGWLAGEGAGVMLIRPVEDAERDRDCIHGLIKGTAISHSGRTMRFGAPNASMMAASMRRAMENAGTAARSISYIEAAAAGAGIADAAEMQAITEVFGNELRTDGPCRVGSVKGNIGHLESASAMSQLTKVLLQMKYGQLAPTLNCRPLNPLVQWKEDEVAVAEASSIWSSSSEAPLCALVNAYGATGSGGHVVLEAYHSPAAAREPGTDAGPFVVPLSAASSEQLESSAKRLAGWLAGHESADLRDIAYTLQTGREALEERLAVIADNTTDLRQKLERVSRGEAPVEGVHRGTSRAKTKQRKIDGMDAATAAKRWVRGDTVNWHFLHQGDERKLPLPAYPFAKVRHWLDTQPAVDPVTAYPTGNEMSEQPAKNSLPEVDLLNRLEAYTAAIFAEISEIPQSQLNLDTPLEFYGIHSMMITRLNGRLERDFAGCPKTLFFECRTLREAAHYLGASFREQALILLVGEKVQPQKAQPVSSPAPGKAGSLSDIAMQYPAGSSRVADASGPIAIVGISGRYPMAATLEEYWRNLQQGRDCITEIPAERWDYRPYYDPEQRKPGKMYCKWGGFVDGADTFDPLFFNISPKEAELMDPQERLFLETVWHTFEDAGYNRVEMRRAFGGRVGVFVGVMYAEYQLYNAIPREGADPASVVSAYGSIANRISYFLDLHGPSLAVDTLCSSSLTALHLAAESIRRGECEAAVAGGVNLSLHPSKYLIHSQMSMSSSDGRCRSFGEGGDGFVPGEGIGAVLLKPLNKAIADGDYIYGIIKGTAVNHGGKTNGYTVPNPSAQAELILDVLRKSEVDARTVSYVEAHGTGTLLGDPIEVAGLTQSFRAYTSDTQYCALGSVKSNIGHLESAAGIAGLTKVLLQMKHKQLVPSLHAGSLNANIDFTNSPFVLQQKLTEWKRPEVERDGETVLCPRRAVISSFGAGGANATVVLEEYEAPRQVLPEETASRQLVVLSAKSAGQLHDYARRLLAAVPVLEAEQASMQDVAYTLQAGREPLEERLAIVADSFAELAEKLEQMLAEQGPVSGVYRGQAQGQREPMSVFAADEDLGQAVEAWLLKGKHGKLAELWVKGVPLEWRLLHGGAAPRKIPLPVYPFLKERYWLPGVDRGAAIAPVSAEYAVAPAFSNSAPAAADTVGGREAEAADKPVIFEEEWTEQAIRPGQAAANTWRNIVYLVSSADSQRVVIEVMNRLAPQAGIIFIMTGGGGGIGPWPTYIADGVSQNAYETAFNSVRRDHGPVDAVVCVWPVEEQAQLRNLAGLSDVVRGISASGLKPRRLVCAVAIRDGLDRCYMEAWVGFARSLGQALPHTQAAVVSCEDALDTGGALNHCLPLLWAELHAAQAESVIYRSGKRLATRLKPVTPVSAGVALKSGGTYLITGGLGALGFALARRIAMRQPVHLVLAGRSPLDMLKRSRIRELEGLGSSVIYVQVDVTDAAGLREAVLEARRNFGRIDGVIHAAGVLNGDGILRSDANSLREEMAPKIDGTLALDEALRGETIDFVCYFSSAAAVLGDFGSCGYAAGNRFQMAYARYRDGMHQHATGQGKSIAMLWPLWRDGGMRFDDDAEAERYLQAGGLRFLETEEGLALFEDLLVHSGSHGLVLAGLPGRIKQLTGIAAVEAAIGEADPSPLPADGCETMGSQAEDGHVAKFVDDELKQQISHILKIPREKLNREENFAGFGFDSISLVDFAGRLTERFHIDIVPPLFYNYSTIEALGRYLLLEHGEALRKVYNQKKAADNAAEDAQRISLNRTEANGVPSVGRSLHADSQTNVTDHSRPASAAARDSDGYEAIAIIGMSGRFPEARNIDEMWAIMKEGREAVHEVPLERWDWRAIDGDPALEPGTTNCKWGGFVPGAAEFDPAFFDISPREAELMDPRGRLLLQETWNALEDAGYGPKQIEAGTVGMFVGMEQGDYALLTEGRGSITSNNNAVLASRLAYVLNLDGPVMAIDTACSSALVAVHQACMSLRNRECDTAIAAGATIIAAQETYVGMSQAGMLSADGKCFAFDRRANGLVPGEAVAAVVLKRLADAEASGDPIYAVIKGSGMNYDGKTNGITAPNGVAQSKLLRNVYDRCGINPEDIEYVAAHGTGTKLGDPVEVNALRDAFATYTDREQYCAIASSKTNFGHTLGTSGLVSLIGMVKALHGECIPASLHFEQENEYIRWEQSPFYVNQTAKPWPRRPEKRRLGAVSAFGMSGTNAHVVLEGYEKQRQPDTAQAPAYLLALSAKSETALQDKIGDLLRMLQDGHAGAPGLAELSRTLLEGRFHFPHRCAFVVRNHEEAIAALLSHRSQEASSIAFGAVPREFSGTPATVRYGEMLLEQSLSQMQQPVLYRDTLLALVELYCQGYEMDFSRLYAGMGIRRIHAPAYPFAKEHYWPTRTRPGTSEAKSQGTAQRSSSAATDDAVSADGRPKSRQTGSDQSHAVFELVDLTAAAASPAITEPVLQAQPGKPARVTLRPLNELASGSPNPVDRSLPFVVLAPTAGKEPDKKQTAAQTVAIPGPVVPDSGNQDDLIRELSGSLAEALFMDASQVEEDRPFIEMGMDSIVGVEWVRAVNKRYGMSIAATKIYDYPTIRAFAAFVAKERSKAAAARSSVPEQVPLQLAAMTEHAAPVRVPGLPEDGPYREPKPAAVLKDKQTASAVNTDTLMEELAESLAEALFIERGDIEDERPFIEMGMDSIVGVEWVRSVNKRYSTKMAATKIYDYPNLRAFAAFLAKECNQSGVSDGIRQERTIPLNLDDVLDQLYQGKIELTEANRLYQLIQAEETEQ